MHKFCFCLEYNNVETSRIMPSVFIGIPNMSHSLDKY